MSALLETWSKQMNLTHTGFYSYLFIKNARYKIPSKTSKKQKRLGKKMKSLYTGCLC